MKNKEINKEYLVNAIKGLPAFSSPENAWEEIEDKLSDNEKYKEIDYHILKTVIDKFYNVKAPAKAWNNIENRLFVIKTRRTKLIKLLKYTSRVAASIILLITLFFLKNKFINPYSHSVEEIQIADIEYSIVPNLNQKKAEQFIMLSCASIVDLCNRKEFKEYQEELKILKEKEEELKRQVLLFENDIELIKYHLKVEMEIERVTKEMIRFIMN